MDTQSRTAEQILADLASRSKGLVKRRDLLARGITPTQINKRLERGALIRVHRGIYRVGHAAPNLETTYLAAVWACGEHAVLSGLAAAHHYELIRGRAPVPEVTCPTERRVKGVITHRARGGRDERTSWRGVPILSVPAVLADIAARLPIRQLARACHEAGVRHKTTPRDVEAVLARRPNSPDAAKLRRIMGGDFQVTLSELERRFLQLLREAGLPLPITNRVADSRRVDCRWPEHRLTVELDSFRFHNSRHSWEQDRQREREARRRGDEFRRYTYADVFEDPAYMLADVAKLLSAASPRAA